MHWTDREFRKLAKKGYRFGFLEHSGSDASNTPSSAFKGANTIEEIFALLPRNNDVDVDAFYGINASESMNGMPPHHYLMQYIFPKDGTAVGAEWWVIGYVVELYLYGE